MVESIGITLIAGERASHESKGYPASHDIGHEGDLVIAAFSYAQFTAAQLVRGWDGETALRASVAVGGPDHWPWAPTDWKPTGDPIRDLTKAGSLIVAAIDALVATRKSELEATDNG